MFILVPPLRAAQPSQKRRMHPALVVPEILLIIFKYVTDASGEPLLPTLAVLARTCRTFQRQVDQLLWYKLPNISALYEILPSQIRNKESRSWSLNRRMLSGPDWKRFMERAGRVRVLVENTSSSSDRNQYERCSVILLAMASLRDSCPVLTPNLHKLEWQTSRPSINLAINLFISPSLLSLEIDAKLFVNRDIHVHLGDACPKLEHLKIIGNARESAGVISSALRGLHFLETLVCSTLDNDAFVHLSRLKKLSYLAVDMRWSVLNFDALRGRFLPGSFESLQSLHWKDYSLDSLAEIFLMPNVSLSNVHLEIESFCTSSSLRTFLTTFTAKFPHTQSFSLIHDTGAGRRFGLQAGRPGREHQLDAYVLKPLLELKHLHVLKLLDLGRVLLDDDFVKSIACALPELEQLHLGTNAEEPTPPFITFDGFLTLLRHCPKLHSLGTWVDAEDMLLFEDTTVRHDCLTHLRLDGSVLGSRRAEVDGMLRRVSPGLKTVDESLDGTTWRVHHVHALATDGTNSMSGGGRTKGRRTRNSLESGA